MGETLEGRERNRVVIPANGMNPLRLAIRHLTDRPLWRRSPGRRRQLRRGCRHAWRNNTASRPAGLLSWLVTILEFMSRLLKKVI